MYTLSFLPMAKQYLPQIFQKAALHQSLSKHTHVRIAKTSIPKKEGWNIRILSHSHGILIDQIRTKFIPWNFGSSFMDSNIMPLNPPQRELFVVARSLLLVLPEEFGENIGMSFGDGGERHLEL
ncbi:hypothetical protein JTE90_019591 [Oedothorax gibbosus]|uniref:Uncharacterized protein n=1 Tax=Oedothorax gibbosus TaxID=931172 RepID=A0AAV6V4X3_9ARAC|nr:hypothetical protein JTE90_019591 [Oedothorax gibbosus]